MARAEGTQDRFPGRKPRKELPVRETVFLLAATPDGELFLERRPESGIWGGLWCFPELAKESDAERFCVERLATPVLDLRVMPGVRHTFSHYHLEIRPLLLHLVKALAPLRMRTRYAPGPPIRIPRWASQPPSRSYGGRPGP